MWSLSSLELAILFFDIVVQYIDRYPAAVKVERKRRCTKRTLHFSLNFPIFFFFRLVHNISHTLFSRYYFPLNTFLFLYCSLISLCEAVKIFRDPRRWRSYERSGTATTTAKRNYLSSENFLPIRYCDLAWLDLECKKQQFGRHDKNFSTACTFSGLQRLMLRKNKIK